MDLHITLGGRREVTVEVYRQIREAVVDGRLRAGEALPSSRELARRLEVSRNSVVLAYERLRAEGFVRCRVGAGTFVGNGIRPLPKPGPADSPLRPRALWEGIPEIPDMSAAEVAFDFRPGIPDAGHFPFAAFRARLTRQIRPSVVGKGAHIDPAGDPELRAAIARHVGVSRAVRTTEADVFVTSGSQQAIDLIARVLLEPGDAVAVEDPGYPLPRRAFQAHGCRVVGVPVDGDGLVVDAIPDGVRLVYVTPSHQYPLGMALSMARRQALLAWAIRADATIVEDDYDSEFRYGGRPLETLQSLGGTGRVLYIGSFSKVLLPTLRLGFVVAPAPLHGALRKAKYVSDWHTNVPLQAATARFIEDGLLARHIRRMRRIYGARHERLVDLLDRDFQGQLTPLPAAGGLHLAALLTGRASSTDVEITRRVGAEGVALFPLSERYMGEPSSAGFLFGYGAIESDRIEEGLRRLHRCM